MNHNSKTLWLTKSYVRALQFTTQHELSYPDRRSSTNSLLFKAQLVALCSIPDQLLLVQISVYFGTKVNFSLYNLNKRYIPFEISQLFCDLRLQNSILFRLKVTHSSRFKFTAQVISLFKISINVFIIQHKNTITSLTHNIYKESPHKINKQTRFTGN